MCFPKVKQSFCCLSLRTGMLFICWISLLCNLVYLCGMNKYEPPDVLGFLDDIPQIQMDKYYYKDFSQLYYVVEVTVMMFALIGIYSNSTSCLNLLVINEAIILVLYVIMTGFQINGNFNDPSRRSPVALYLLITVFKYYTFVVILSYYHEVSQGRDGTGRGGVIITTTVASPYAAPQAVHNQPIVPSAPYIDSPYAVQPPHAPIMAQPCNPMYPQEPFPHVIIQTDVPVPCAPPPYLTPQSPVANCEKPPPYAP